MLTLSKQITRAGRGFPVRAVAHVLGEQDTRRWRTIEHYGEHARAEQDMSQVHSVGMDETASRAGHEYLTLFADQESARVLFVASGKDARTVSALAKALKQHGAKPQRIKAVCRDMSPAFESGLSETFPEARQVVDRFHGMLHRASAMVLVNDALDKIRRAEVKAHPVLKKRRSIWLPSEAQ